MGSSSAVFTLCFHTNTSTPKFIHHSKLSFDSLKPFSLNNPHRRNPKTKLLFSSKPPKIITHLTKPSPKNSLHRFFLEKAVGFLVGSIIFVGCFNIRSAIAVPSQTSSSTANLEEISDAQIKDSEDEELYERILEKEPKNVEALKVVLYGKMRRGKTKEALKYVERLADLEPEEVEWKLLKALSYEMTGQLSVAKRLFKEILKEKPLLLRALHGLALAMHKNHEGPGVFKMLNEALEIARCEKRVTEERNIRILIAQMHVVRGELEEGLQEFRSLVDEDHRDFRPYLCLGIIYSLMDKKEEAAEQFETYRALVPEEFPQRGFLDDVVLAAKTNSREQLHKEFNAEYSNLK